MELPWFVLVAGVAFLGSLAPIFSVELYLVGMAVTRPELPWWGLALSIASGQLAGKLVHYAAARGAVALPWLRDPRSALGTRLTGLVRRLEILSAQRPWTCAAVVLGSSTVGLPPFTLLVPAAGAIRLPLRVLLPPAVLGRVLRFGVIAATPGVFHDLYLGVVP
ncbi:hypothetical protein C1701_10150 [Actinoalloteichus sp. AHMU CJ021]|uniref:Membrane-associated protein n=1 Tax=Actinoalloteichus caeruleus DSM 43889 TaxID=1120930 RepID=A0ABT1JJW9_ACTCY|nr:hypothetical protein [Actinoalloteichus caeruleus]AUS78668.1 hypothetical protein C1701_10150 [Actinoalloteichus sp. AHMU CJ021]MCP2332808.1 hypothetical protein [Actinoalloteichus caeruleus DSM 43889]